jgi:2'-5' RNA ligase
MSRRLFIGVEPPEDIKGALLRLEYGLPDIRWVPPESFHITLRFLGNVDEASLPELDYHLGSISFAAMHYSINGIGYFKKGKYCTHLWAGIAPDEDFMEFARSVNAYFEPGITAQKFARNYKPHITLARPKKREMKDVTSFLEHNALFKIRDIPLTEFHVYESFLHEDGPEYQIIGTYQAQDAGLHD